jgi:hypothetical protein
MWAASQGPLDVQSTPAQRAPPVGRAVVAAAASGGGRRDSPGGVADPEIAEYRGVPMAGVRRGSTAPAARGFDEQPPARVLVAVDAKPRSQTAVAARLSPRSPGARRACTTSAHLSARTEGCRRAQSRPTCLVPTEARADPHSDDESKPPSRSLVRACLSPQRSVPPCSTCVVKATACTTRRRNPRGRRRLDPSCS